MRKLFVFDVDGTLLPNLNGSIPVSAIASINSLLEKGHAICIASGRPFSGISYFLDQFGSGLKYAGIANGSMLKSREGEILWAKYLIQDDLDYFCQKYKNREDLSIYAYSDDDSVCFYRISEFVRMEIAINFMKSVQLTDDRNPRHYTKIMIAASTPEAAAKLHLTAEESSRYDATTSGPLYFEIIPKGTGKAILTEMLRRHLDIKKEDVYCFGDSPNDLEMIATFNGVAMGNACAQVKEVAKYETRRCDEDGIAFALKEILGFVD